MKELNRIQKMLRPGLHVHICHTVANDWMASIMSTQRDSPPRVSFIGLTADSAFANLLAFLRGNKPDANYSPQKPEQYLLAGSEP